MIAINKPSITLPDFNTNKLVVKVKEDIMQPEVVLPLKTKELSQNILPSEKAQEEYMFEIY